MPSDCFAFPKQAVGLGYITDGKSFSHQILKQVQTYSKKLCSLADIHPVRLQVLPVELPGRNSRMKEPRLENMSALVEAILQGIGPLLNEGPFAFFGHSMGAWVAYSLTKELQRRGGPLPVTLFVSGNRSPTLAGIENDLDPVSMHTLEPHDFWNAMERRYGENPDLKNESMKKFIMPLLQSDFTVVETYEAPEDAIVPCPLVVLGGNSDNRYNEAQLEAWTDCSTEEMFRGVHWFDGDHSFLKPNIEQVISLIGTELEVDAKQPFGSPITMAPIKNPSPEILPPSPFEMDRTAASMEKEHKRVGSVQPSAQVPKPKGGCACFSCF